MCALGVLAVSSLLAGGSAMTQAQTTNSRPNIVVLMADDTGWSDFGAYGGGQNLGHPTPNVDRVAAEGAVFTVERYESGSAASGQPGVFDGYQAPRPNHRLSRLAV
jgi:hypothetical protein